ARLLLDQGADPNAGYLWEGLPSPFTALTGVFGRGEQGAPPHHQEMALARLLLEAGAEANDSQTIYNRGLGDLATDDTGFLELLLDFGLGRGDGGPWRRLLGPAHHSPGDLVAEALQHAAEAGLIERARLLLARGADPNRPGLHPGFAGRHPYEGAVLHGNLEMAELLGAAGADTSTVDSLTRFVGACLSGDGDAVDAALAADATLLDRALEGRADLVARAAELGRPGAVRLLSELGFDVNARRRTTALHEAALRGDLDVVEVLMALGGDPSIVDTEFESPPRGWAAHTRQVAVVEYFDHRNPPA
ncbi:MAG: ankyrin repeat domain-containing protein, partial [Acidimicrobiales bacterium]